MYIIYGTISSRRPCANVSGGAEPGAKDLGDQCEAQRVEAPPPEPASEAEGEGFDGEADGDAGAASMIGLVKKDNYIQYIYIHI